MGKGKKKPKKAKKRKTKKAPRVKGPLWKVWLYTFLFGEDPPKEGMIRARIAKRGPLAKRLTRRFRR